MPKIDYDQLTAAECRVIAQRALEQLLVRDIITILKAILDEPERLEVIANLEEA